MSLFKHSYSGLITKGLGSSACCGLLTLGFHLFFCKIEIIIPPIKVKTNQTNSGKLSTRLNIPPIKVNTNQTNSGKSSTRLNIPPREIEEDEDSTKRIIRLTINLKGSHQRVHEYSVSHKNAKLAVHVINAINVTANRVGVQLSPIINATKQFTAAFNRTK